MIFLSNDPLCVYFSHGVICFELFLFVWICLVLLVPAVAGISLFETELALHDRDALYSSRLRFQLSLQPPQIHRVRFPKVLRTPVQAERW